MGWYIGHLCLKGHNDHFGVEWVPYHLNHNTLKMVRAYCSIESSVGYESESLWVVGSVMISIF